MNRIKLVFLGILTAVMPTLGQITPSVNYPVSKAVEDKPFLFYINGRSIQKWCLVTESGENFKVIYGTVGAANSSVDSLLVSSPALTWGLTEFHKIYKPSAEAPAGQGNTGELIVRSDDNSLLEVKQINKDEYAAADAENINNLYHTLYWLSAPKNQRANSKPANLIVAKKPTVLMPAYDHKDKGFFAAVEFQGAISVGHGYLMDAKDHNMSLIELDAVGGWKFSERFGVGLGMGGRKYFKTTRMFAHSWGLPIYLDIRGDILSYKTHKFSPFWVMDLGYSIPDGFMFRPQFGFKFGQPYKFTVSIVYLGQFMRKYKYKLTPSGDITNLRDGFKRELFSCPGLKIGYEF